MVGVGVGVGVRVGTVVAVSLVGVKVGVVAIWMLGCTLTTWEAVGVWLKMRRLGMLLAMTKGAVEWTTYSVRGVVGMLGEVHSTVT